MRGSPWRRIAPAPARSCSAAHVADRALIGCSRELQQIVTMLRVLIPPLLPAASYWLLATVALRPQPPLCRCTAAAAVLRRRLRLPEPLLPLLPPAFGLKNPSALQIVPPASALRSAGVLAVRHPLASPTHGDRAAHATTRCAALTAAPDGGTRSCSSRPRGRRCCSGDGALPLRSAAGRPEGAQLPLLYAACCQANGTASGTHRRRSGAVCAAGGCG